MADYNATVIEGPLVRWRVEPDRHHFNMTVKCPGGRHAFIVTERVTLTLDGRAAAWADLEPYLAGNDGCGISARVVARPLIPRELHLTRHPDVKVLRLDAKPTEVNEPFEVEPVYTGADGYRETFDRVAAARGGDIAAKYRAVGDLRPRDHFPAASDPSHAILTAEQIKALHDGLTVPLSSEPLTLEEARHRAIAYQGAQTGKVTLNPDGTTYIVMDDPLRQVDVPGVIPPADWKPIELAPLADVGAVAEVAFKAGRLPGPKPDVTDGDVKAAAYGERVEPLTPEQRTALHERIKNKYGGRPVGKPFVMNLPAEVVAPADPPPLPGPRLGPAGLTHAYDWDGSVKPVEEITYIDPKTGGCRATGRLSLNEALELYYRSVTDARCDSHFGKSPLERVAPLMFLIDDIERGSVTVGPGASSRPAAEPPAEAPATVVPPFPVRRRAEDIAPLRRSRMRLVFKVVEVTPLSSPGSVRLGLECPIGVQGSSIVSRLTLSLAGPVVNPDGKSPVEWPPRVGDTVPVSVDFGGMERP